MNDLEVWLLERQEWRREGIHKPAGCPRYYTGCQCSRCLARDKAEAEELAKELTKN